MTDNEIIKALDCFSGKEIYCKNCAYRDNSNMGICRRNAAKDTIDLINRQKAEIERLRSEVKEKTETIDFLKDQAVGWCIDFCNLKAKLDTAKPEAIKEFAERVKKESSSFVACNGDHVIEETRGYQISGITLDKIKREMVGEGL